MVVHVQIETEYQKFIYSPENISTHLSTISNSRYPQFQKEQKRHRVQIPSFDCNHCSQTKKTITIRRRRRRITEITKLKYEKRNREGERVWLPVILKMKMRKKRDSKLFTVFYSYIELALYKKNIKKGDFLALTLLIVEKLITFLLSNVDLAWDYFIGVLGWLLCCVLFIL